MKPPWINVTWQAWQIPFLFMSEGPMTISCLARVPIFVEGSLRDHLWKSIGGGMTPEKVRILHGVMTNQFFPTSMAGEMQCAA